MLSHAYSDPIIIAESDLRRPEFVQASDLDGDGDLDVLSASKTKIAWYKNTDGQGTFGRQLVIATMQQRLSSILPVDLDSDLDVDVLVAFSYDGNVGW